MDQQSCGSRIPFASAKGIIGLAEVRKGFIIILKAQTRSDGGYRLSFGSLSAGQDGVSQILKTSLPVVQSDSGWLGIGLRKLDGNQTIGVWR
jgi:hypothetical protein